MSMDARNSETRVQLTVLRGCCAKICAAEIMAASLLSCFARSII